MSNPTVVIPESQNPAWTRETARAVSEMERVHEPEIVLLSVLDPDTVDESVNLDDRVSERTAVQIAKAELVDVGLSISILGVSSSKRADGIVRALEQVDADRAYMYGRNRTPTGKAVFGSTLGEVIARSPMPIVVVPPANG